MGWTVNKDQLRFLRISLCLLPGASQDREANSPSPGVWWTYLCVSTCVCVYVPVSVSRFVYVCRFVQRVYALLCVFLRVCVCVCGFMCVWAGRRIAYAGGCVCVYVSVLLSALSGSKQWQEVKWGLKCSQRCFCQGFLNKNTSGQNCWSSSCVDLYVLSLDGVLEMCVLSWRRYLSKAFCDTIARGMVVFHAMMVVDRTKWQSKVKKS